MSKRPPFTAANPADRSAIVEIVPSEPRPTSTTDTYHHGDLRREMLDAAVRSIAETGPAALSLRALAAEAGVSHAAPVHHFGDKAGLFSAVAAEGFDLLADQLLAVWSDTRDFLEMGVTYVRFALEHRGHFDVMFRPELHNLGDRGLVEAKRRAFTALGEPLSTASPTGDDLGDHWTALSSWSVVHGLATLALGGNLPPSDLADPDELARQVLLHLPFNFALSYDRSRHDGPGPGRPELAESEKHR